MTVSPGDVATERNVAREVIHEWNVVDAENQCTVRPDSVDEKRHNVMRQSKALITKRGFIEEYESIPEFRKKLSRQLAQTVIEHYSISTNDAQELTSNQGVKRVESAGGVPELLGEARELMPQLMKRPNGLVLMLDTWPPLLSKGTTMAW
jgi:hypothetical protein